MEKMHLHFYHFTLEVLSNAIVYIICNGPYLSHCMRTDLFTNCMRVKGRKLGIQENSINSERLSYPSHAPECV